jgi:hypothetical protein
MKGAWAIPPAIVSPDYPGSKVRKHIYPDIPLQAAMQGVITQKLDLDTGLSIVRFLAEAATAVSGLHEVLHCTALHSLGPATFVS